MDMEPSLVSNRHEGIEETSRGRATTCSSGAVPAPELPPLLWLAESPAQAHVPEPEALMQQERGLEAFGARHHTHRCVRERGGKGWCS